MGKSPSRPSTFAKPGTDADGGPGTYDSPVKFGKDVKTFTIGEKRHERIENDPRDYSPERGEALTKAKTPNIDMGKSQSRPSTFAKPGTDADGGPGTYDSPVKFGKDIISFKIGEKRPERIDNDNRDYSPERAEALTKAKTPNVDMGKSPSRPSTFAKPGTDADGGPGTYDSPVKFGDNVKPFKIGEKRPHKIDTDNRDYSPERAEALTKTKVP